MNCASCHTPLPENSNYCNLCANKVQNGRITLKGTWSEFISPVFSWDNHFLKTFKHLITQPEKVLLAYINGDRKSYFKPFAFMIVYGVLYSLYFKFFPSNMKKGLEEGAKFGKSISTNSEVYQTNFFNSYIENVSLIQEWLQLNMNIFMMIAIPIYAIASYLIYQKYKNNIPEHWVFNAYIATISSYFILVYYITLNCFGIDLYQNLWITSLSFIFYFIFYNYSFFRLYKLNSIEVFFSNIKFIGLLIPLYLLFGFTVALIAGIYTLYQIKLA